MPLIKRSEFADAHGWHRSYVSRLVQQGVVMLTTDGLVDSEDADRRIAAARDPKKQHVTDRHAKARAGGRPPPARDRNASINATYHQAKTFREGFEARLAQLKYEKAIGELIPAADVQRHVYESYKRVASALDQIADLLAPMVAAESDPFVIREIIDVEISRIRNELADFLELET